MKILILGSNDVAYTLAQVLSKMDHAITVVDNKVDQIKHIDRELDVKGIIGYPTYPFVLDKADCATTDILIAVLDQDEANMVACQIAHSLFNVPLKIARIKNHHYLNQKKLYGNQDLPIDVFISPEIVLSKQITSLINFPGVEEIRFFDSAYIILIKITPTSAWVGQTARALEQAHQCIISHTFSNKKWQQITPKYKVNTGDEILLSAKRGNISKILASAGIDNPDIKHIMIGGLGHNGTNLIRSIQHEYNIKAIEKDIHQCKRSASEFDDLTILHGKISDRQLLEEEGISRVDFYCALTDDESENILSSLIAKKSGCKKVLCLLKNTSYSDCISDHVDHILLSKIAVINAILTEIHKGRSIDAVKSIRGGEITLFKMKITEHFKYLNKPIKSIPFPNTTNLLGIIRKEDFYTDKDLIVSQDDFMIFSTIQIIDIQNMDNLFKFA